VRQVGRWQGKMLAGLSGRGWMMLSFVLGSSLRLGRCASSSQSSCTAASGGRCAVKMGAQVADGPKWRIVTEYPSLSSRELRSDMEEVAKMTEEIREQEKVVAGYVAGAQNVTVDEADKAGVIAALAKMSEIKWNAERNLRNVGVYAACEKSVDGSNAEARKLTLEVQSAGAALRGAMLSKDLFLMRCGDDLVRKYLSSSDITAAEAAMLQHQRKLRDSRLSLDEEKLITSLTVHGHSSWGTMYSNLASTTKCDVTLRDGTSTTVGFASAAAMLDSTTEEIRRAAWEGIRRGWLVHEESCASALNAMVGWRLELYERRKQHFLDVPLHQNRLRKETLDAMLSAVKARSEIARNVLKLKARVLGKEKLDAWDLFAPPPPSVGDDGSDLRYSFDEGVALIKESVGSVHPDMGSFVQMMADNGWIEARTADTKVPGAYQTSFAKSRTPRVYLSNYNGGATHVLTLAHELGHAYHYWVMRELPLAETSLGMNVAETASIFFETVVTHALLNRASSSSEKLRLLWAASASATTFLLNIPARFYFEEDLHVRRAEQALTPKDLTKMMERAWRDQYGDALGELETHFWQSKLHFYITEVCFYNFPYTFGWLLAHGVYMQKDSLGDQFVDAYNALLRDTGRMDTEELVSKHLKKDITDTKFWHDSVDAVEKLCKSFEQEVENFMPLKAAGPIYTV